MHRTSTLVSDGHSGTRTALVQDNISRLSGLNSTRHSQRMKVCFIERREQGLLRNGKKASVQSHLEVAVISTNGVVDSDQMCSSCKGSFDLHLFKGAYD